MTHAPQQVPRATPQQVPAPRDRVHRLRAPAPRDRAHGLRALRDPLGVAVLGVAAAAVVATVDPNEPGHYPTCPFLALTGHLCPGCGSLRAVHALAHGDLVGAAGMNLLAVLAVAPLAVIWVAWVRRTWRGTARRTAAPPQALWSLLVLVVVFTLARNLTVGSVLAP